MGENAHSRLIIDLQTRRVWRGEQELELSGLEYSALKHLAEQVGTVISYEELWRQVWGGVGRFGKHECDMVREAVKRLRRKLSDDPNEPYFLVVVYGRGIYLTRAMIEVREG
ncbi:MAG: response regulator transcription factor [Chloroflexi bacterium]|nr:response regulator transcription factor [Chloroflexota bacterium]